MAFRVKMIEFDCSKAPEMTNEMIAGGFQEVAEFLKYIPTIKSKSEIKIEEEMATIKFKRTFALSTVEQVLFDLFNSLNHMMEIEEIEYKPESKKVEVEIKTRK